MCIIHDKIKIFYPQVKKPTFCNQLEYCRTINRVNIAERQILINIQERIILIDRAQRIKSGKNNKQFYIKKGVISKQKQIKRNKVFCDISISSIKETQSSMIIPDMTLSINKKLPAELSHHVIKLPEQEQQQNLSYQSNKISHYVELQLSDLENTLHYIQKKHSINQIKESISHAYSIFSETEPLFRQLRIVFIYNKIKKLVNCFSIIYLILIEHVEKPSKIFIQTNKPNNNSDFSQSLNLENLNEPTTRRTQQRKTQFLHESESQTGTNYTKKPKTLGGVHLYNQQYNRHIESDLDRLKRKLKQQPKGSQQMDPKVTEKDKFKEEILKEINTDIYHSSSPDQLSLFFNLNSNKNGSQFQYITFEDELQEIATFFKQSQDQALEFLNKSRDEFVFSNFNQGFKEIMDQCKIEKQEQLNCFVSKVKKLFEAIKIKTKQRQNQINHQIAQLKKIQKRISKPVCLEIETQTSFSFQDQFSKFKKKIEESQSNYRELQNYHSKVNENDSKKINILEQKIAFKENQVFALKKQLDQKSNFIDFLNDKINSGTDPKFLKKISNIYRSHSKKNSSKIKVQLQQLEKQVKIDQIGLKDKQLLAQNNDYDQYPKRQIVERQIQDQEEKFGQKQKKFIPIPFQDFKKPNKKKRKQGMSFFASPQIKTASYVERNASFNVQNTRIDEENSQMQKSISGDMNLYKEQYLDNNQKIGLDQSSAKKDKQTKNLVKADRRKSQDRNSLQLIQKSKQKNLEPKRSMFASGFGNNKIIKNQLDGHGVDKRRSSMTRQNISQQANIQNLEEQELLRKINRVGNQNKQGLPYGNDKNDYDSKQYDMDIERDQQNFNYDETDEGEQNGKAQTQNKRIFLNRAEVKPEISQLKIKNLNGARNLANQTIAQFSHEKRCSSFFKKRNQQAQGNQLYSFIKQQSGIQSSYQKQNNEGKQKNLLGMNAKVPMKKNHMKKFNQSKKELSRTTYQNQQGDSTQNFEGQIIKKRKNMLQSQGFKQNQDKQYCDFDDEKDQVSEVSNNEIIKFLKNIPGKSNFDCLNSEQKDKMISTYFTTIYKDKKIKSSNICSRLIDIVIGQDKLKPRETQLLLQLSLDASIQENKVYLTKLKSPISKAQDIKTKFKQPLSANLNQLKQKGYKISEQSMPNSIIKLREDHRIGQNINFHANTLKTFKDIAVTSQVKGQYYAYQRVTKKVIQQISDAKQNSAEKKQRNSTNYERIYGVSMSSWHRNKRQNTQFSLMNQQDKQKMQDRLEKVAMKLAIKSKNVDQFKAKIKKIHFSKCGQKCKHLERYLQNFNKYRCSNREIMKIHIQNVHDLIPSESMTRLNKQNSLTFPSINLLCPAKSLKSFGSIQRNVGAASKK